MRKHRNETKPDLAVIKARIDYDPATGALKWAHCGPETFDSPHAWKVWTAKFSGRPVRKMLRGYLVISVSHNGKTHYCRAHRVAWALVTGDWPEHEIDHIDRDRSNNAWANLREATHQQNQWNKGANTRNRSGVVGVHQHSQNGKWIAQIAVEGKTRHLGSFSSKDEAVAARTAAAVTYHGQFAQGQ